MFETAGAPTILEPVYTLVGLVLLPLVAAIVAAWSGRRVASRVAIACSGGALALAIVLAARVAAAAHAHALFQHVAQIVRVGQLDLALDLELDGASAAFAVVVAAVGLAAVLHAAWTTRAPIVLVVPPPSTRALPDAPDSASDLSPPSSSGRDVSARASAPNASAPNASAPDASAPDASAPASARASASEASAPDVSAPDASAPDASAPASAPDVSAPDASAPASAPDVSAPASAPDASAPKGPLDPPSSERLSARVAASSPSLEEIEPEELLDDEPLPKDDLAGRLAWIELLTASALLVAIADAWPVVVAGLAASTVASWGLARASSPRALVAALAGDACVLFGACFLFWALGGAFGPSGYTPDARPRFALVQAIDERAPPGKSTLALTTYAGAQLVADDGPPLPGEPIRAPLAVTLDPGTVSLRVLAGVASQDALVSHVTLAPGKAYVLLPFGPTASLRNLTDQLAVSRPNAIPQAPPVPLRTALAQRHVLGVRVGLVAALLILGGLLLKLALAAVGARRRAGGGGGRPDGAGLDARDGASAPLEVLPSAFLALRLAPFAEPGASSSALLAAIAALAAVVLGAAGAASRDARSALRAVVAAAAAIAIAGALAGDPGGALVVVASAALGCAAALSALEAGGDVRWLGVACAATAGILPAAGSSSGFAGALAAAFASASRGAGVAIAATALLLLAMALVALGALRVYDAAIRRRRAPSGLGRGPRVLAAALAAIALAGGVVLGVGTSPFGGHAAPLARRVVAGGSALDSDPRRAAAALAAAIAAAAAGVLAARISAGSAGPRWSAFFSLPARALDTSAGGVARAAGFFARSVASLDRDVVDDVTDLVSAGVLRAGSALRRAARATGAGPGRALDAGATAALARVGLDDPRAAERLRTGVLLGMVALLVLVVLSSLVFG
jgi:hypothetical protein